MVSASSTATGRAARAPGCRPPAGRRRPDDGAPHRSAPDMRQMGLARPARAGQHQLALPGQSRQPSISASAGGVGGRARRNPSRPCAGTRQIKARAGEVVMPRGASGRLQRPRAGRARDRAGCPCTRAISEPGEHADASPRRGTATSSPTKPNSAPKTDSAKQQPDRMQPDRAIRPAWASAHCLRRTGPSTKMPATRADRAASRPRTGTAPDRWPARRRPAHRHRG